MIKNVLYNIGCTLIGTNTEKEYSEILNIADTTTLQAFTEQKFIDLIMHAYRHTQYYHEVFNQIGIIKNNHVDISRFHEIPLLTKEIIRQHFDELISDDYEKRGWFYATSGGSTGEPVKLIHDRQFLRWARAVNNYYYRNILNIDEPRVKKIIIWGSEKDLFMGTIGIKAKISNWITNTIILNSFRMTPDDIDKYIDIINAYKPDLIRGYAGSLFEICRYVERNGKDIYSPKYICSAAETLSDEIRDQIERVFGRKLYDFYGSRETPNLAGECKDGLMHSFAFYNYQELLDQYNYPVRQGKEGKVVVTNLFNYSMPLIRYEIGDMAILGPKRCSCGNILPTFKKVTGRITDHFVLHNGTLIYGEYFTHLFYLKDWVEKFQIIQEDYDKIRLIVVVRGKISNKNKNDINEKIRVVMGHECKIIWNIVDDIPQTPSGKYLYTKSLVRR